jgi:hypothetical protein
MKRRGLSSEFLGFLAGLLLFLFIPSNPDPRPNQSGLLLVGCMIGFGIMGAAVGWFVGLVLRASKHDGSGQSGQEAF